MWVYNSFMCGIWILHWLFLILLVSFMMYVCTGMSKKLKAFW
jgi:hypothetical protein